MLKRDWGVYVAIGLIAGGSLTLLFLVGIVGLNYCPGSPCKYYDGSEQNLNKHSQENLRWLPFAFGPNTTNQLGPDDQEGSDHYYTRQDLRAQESVARATNAIVVLTAISIVIGAIGVASVVVTIYLNIKAVTTANEANLLTRMDQRPWVVLELRPFNGAESLLIPDTNRRPWDMPPHGKSASWYAYRIKNIGKSPAISVTVTGHPMTIIKSPEPYGNYPWFDALRDAAKKIVGDQGAVFNSIQTATVFPNEETRWVSTPALQGGTLLDTRQKRAGEEIRVVYVGICVCYPLADGTFGIDFRVFPVQDYEPVFEKEVTFLRITH